MYKQQMRLQKLLCLFSLIAGGVVFLYSLGIMTDLYDSLYFTMRSSDPTKVAVPGTYVYYEMQGFNKLFVKTAIVLILVAAFLFVSNTHSRRRYYISNFIAIGLFSVYAMGLTVWTHIQIQMYKAKFLQIDFAALKEYSEKWNTFYTESTMWLDLHYVIFGILLLLAVLHIANLIWKLTLMKNEAELLSSGEKGSKA